MPTVLLFIGLFHFASAEVLVHSNEFSGYFDSKGIYTVYGSVRNLEDHPAISKVLVTVNVSGKTFVQSKILPLVFPSKDMPFKFNFPQITSGNPVLSNPTISYILTNSPPLNLEIIYDNTLIRYPDGHLSGFIKNTGIDVRYNINVYALVHKKNNEFLDEVQSTKQIVRLGPGEKAQFVMYPDPVISKQVAYYSCFIPGTDNSVELWTTWNGKKFYFSVLSIVYFTNQNFNSNDNSISLDAANPWGIPYYANFMFPRDSGNGSFKVFVDSKQINPLISYDNDTSNWHVAFNLDYGQHKVVVSGFNPNYIPNSDEFFFLDPKSAMLSWGGYTTFTISDSKFLDVLHIKGTHVPHWMRGAIGYMAFGYISEGDIINEIKYLYQMGIVR